MEDRSSFVGTDAELPTPNLPLLRKVLDHIDAHPEEYNQRLYYDASKCGTAFCVAGHAVAMSEGVVDFGFDIRPASDEDWDVAACRALGIEAWEGAQLFDPDNTRADVQRHVEAIAARAGERL